MPGKIGSSAGRTPFKHELYNKLLGQIVGVAGIVDFIDKIVIIDACGGSGAPSVHSGTSSPAISLHHFFGATENRRELQAELFLIEQDAFTVTELSKNIDSWIKDYIQNEFDLWEARDAAYDAISDLVHIAHDNYKSQKVAQQIKLAITPRTAAFLYIDPNHAHDVELSEPLRKALPDKTTMLVTWGCNAGGLKMLPLENKRSKWFERLQYLLELKRPNHNACLTALRRDDSQWAYLLTVPHKWTNKVEKNVESLGELHWVKGVEYYWLNDQNAKFWELAERLFLTKEERNGKI